MTLEEVGNLIGVTKSSVSQWERGETIPYLPKLVELARFFGQPLGDITGQESAEVSIDGELKMLDEVTAHILRKSFLASIKEMKTLKNQ